MIRSVIGECLANKLRHKTLSGGGVSQNDVGDVGHVFQDCFYIPLGRKVDASIWPGTVLEQSILKRPLLSAEGRERHMLRASADELLLQVVQATPDTDLGHVDSHALPAGADEVELSLGSGSLVGECLRWIRGRGLMQCPGRSQWVELSPGRVHCRESAILSPWAGQGSPNSAAWSR